MVLTAIPVGFVAGLFGIGGGLITVPFLYYIFNSFGIDQQYLMHLAVGTSFAIIIPTSTVSVLTHHKFKAVDFDIVKSYGIYVILGVIIGTIFAASLKTKSLVLFFSIIIFLLSIYLLAIKEKEEDALVKIKLHLKIILGFIVATSMARSKLGNLMQGIRDDENRIRFLGYNVEAYKLFVFVISAVMASIAGALYYPQAGIVNPTELAPIASIYLAVWVSIGGRGKLIGAVLGAAFVSLVSSFFTSGKIPNLDLGFFVISWVDWWLVILGLSFVAVTLFAPGGLLGAFWFLVRKGMRNG